MRLLPWGTAAWRVNLLSVICGALAAAQLFEASLLMLKGLCTQFSYVHSALSNLRESIVRYIWRVGSSSALSCVREIIVCNIWRVGGSSALSCSPS